MKSGLFAAIITLLFYSAASFAQDAVYRYEKGKEYNYLAESKSEMIQEAMGQTANITREGTVSFAVMVDTVMENGNLHVTMRIDNALVISEDPRGTNTGGSELAGKTFGATIKNTGKIVGRDSTEELGSSQNAQIVKQLQEMFESLDAEKLVLGSEWETTRTDTVAPVKNSQILAERTSVYKVVGVETRMDRECLHIEINSEVEIGGNMVQGSQDLQISGEQTVKGYVYYDQKEGILIESTEETSGEQTISDPNSSMKVLITGITNSKVEFLP